MLEEPADKVGPFILAAARIIKQRLSWQNSALAKPKSRVKKIGFERVRRKEGFLHRPFLCDLTARRLPNWNPPTSQEMALVLQNVFVKNVHVPRGYMASSWACSRKVSRTSRTASAIASSVMLPRHSSMMLFHARPAAICSRTSATRIRVPRNVGCPWQIFV